MESRVVNILHELPYVISMTTGYLSLILVVLVFLSINPKNNSAN